MRIMIAKIYFVVLSTKEVLEVLGVLGVLKVNIRYSIFDMRLLRIPEILTVIFVLLTS